MQNEDTDSKNQERNCRQLWSVNVNEATTDNAVKPLTKYISDKVIRKFCEFVISYDGNITPLFNKFTKPRITRQTK